MFEMLFTYPGVLRRHREGPLAEERAACLDQCVAPATLIKQARCCLRVAVELAHWPPDTQRSVGPHRAAMPASIFVLRSSICCSVSAVYGWSARDLCTVMKLCCASSSRCSTNGVGCPTSPASLGEVADYEVPRLPRTTGFGSGANPSRWDEVNRKAQCGKTACCV